MEARDKPLTSNPRDVVIQIPRKGGAQMKTGYTTSLRNQALGRAGKALGLFGIAAAAGAGLGTAARGFYNWTQIPWDDERDFPYQTGEQYMMKKPQFSDDFIRKYGYKSNSRDAEHEAFSHTRPYEQEWEESSRIPLYDIRNSRLKPTKKPDYKGNIAQEYYDQPEGRNKAFQDLNPELHEGKSAWERSSNQNRDLFGDDNPYVKAGFVPGRGGARQQVPFKGDRHFETYRMPSRYWSGYRNRRYNRYSRKFPRKGYKKRRTYLPRSRYLMKKRKRTSYY